MKKGNKKQEEKDMFLGTIIVANENDVDIYNIHIYEKSIRFDKNISDAINSNEELEDQVSQMNKLWMTCSINMREDFFVELTKIMTEYEDILSPHFFKSWQLDEKGHIKNDNKNDFELETSYEEGQSYLYYSYLKHSKKLKKITRKNFEKHIVNEEVVNFYIDNYNKRKAQFYSYNPQKLSDETFYFMVVGNRIKIGMSA